MMMVEREGGVLRRLEYCSLGLFMMSHLLRLAVRVNAVGPLRGLLFHSNGQATPGLQHCTLSIGTTSLSGFREEQVRSYTRPRRFSARLLQKVKLAHRDTREPPALLEDPLAPSPATLPSRGPPAADRRPTLTPSTTLPFARPHLPKVAPLTQKSRFRCALVHRQPRLAKSPRHTRLNPRFRAHVPGGYLSPLPRVRTVCGVVRPIELRNKYPRRERRPDQRRAGHTAPLSRPCSELRNFPSPPTTSHHSTPRNGDDPRGSSQSRSARTERIYGARNKSGL